MADFNVADRVLELCKDRSWSLYRLVSIEKICSGFGITLSQFFSEENELAKLSVDERECLSHWAQIGPEDKKLTLAYMQALADRQGRIS